VPRSSLLTLAERGVCLRPYTTLRAGGPAEFFGIARTADVLGEMACEAQKERIKATYLGAGSNVLPSDDGVPGLVLLNAARRIEMLGDGEIVADAGCSFQELFLKAAQASLAGLEFAVGIPGTVGGALVSNAGAYRSNIAESVTSLEIVHGGERGWVDPKFMQFAYRDSILRRLDPPPVALVRVHLKLNFGDPKAIYDEAREYQRQRISKQPPPASAGSFFKNVYDAKLAESLDELPARFKTAGVVPSGFLIERVGLKGHRLGGAVLGPLHANFIVNVGRATASAIRSLAELAKRRVREEFGVTLEEEVMYLGDWSAFEAAVAH
jgi:UDP-N-acetylmuramate dehydrogenase